jgi:hypothetical protein
MQSVSVNLTRADVLVFQFRMLWVHPVNRIAFFAVLAFCTCMAWKAFDFNLGLRELCIAVIVGLLFALVAMLLGFGFILLFVLFGRHRNTLGQRRFTITDEGLAEASEFGSQLLKWGGSARILRTRRMIYVQIATGLYHLIPRRHFASAEADQAFWSALQPLVASESASR